jgi:hypothetical protein
MEPALQPAAKYIPLRDYWLQYGCVLSQLYYIEQIEDFDHTLAGDLTICGTLESTSL